MKRATQELKPFGWPCWRNQSIRRDYPIAEYRADLAGTGVERSVYVQTNWAPADFAKDKDTFALYRFDEGQGDVLKDSSGNGYHGKIVGSKTMVLINKVHDQKVLVFMDRLRDDRTLELPPGVGSDLNIFRREVGKLVLYEVTPLDKPEVIDRLNPPAQAPR